MKLALTLIIGLGLGAFCVYGLIKSSNKLESYIGKQVVIQKDTLLIVNWSYDYGLKLSNGVTVSEKIIEEKLIKN